MKVTVRISVIDGPRQVSAEFDVDAGNPYGQHPAIGALEKAMSLTPKIVQTALESVPS